MVSLKVRTIHAHTHNLLVSKNALFMHFRTIYWFPQNLLVGKCNTHAHIHIDWISNTHAHIHIDWISKCAMHMPMHAISHTQFVAFKGHKNTEYMIRCDDWKFCIYLCAGRTLPAIESCKTHLWKWELWLCVAIFWVRALIVCCYFLSQSSDCVLLFSESELWLFVGICK